VSRENLRFCQIRLALQPDRLRVEQR